MFTKSAVTIITEIRYIDMGVLNPDTAVGNIKPFIPIGDYAKLPAVKGVEGKDFYNFFVADYSGQFYSFRGGSIGDVDGLVEKITKTQLKKYTQYFPISLF